MVDLPGAAIPTTRRLCADAARSRVSRLNDASQSLDALDVRVTNAGGPEQGRDPLGRAAAGPSGVTSFGEGARIAGGAELTGGSILAEVPVHRYAVDGIVRRTRDLRCACAMYLRSRRFEVRQARPSEVAPVPKQTVTVEASATLDR